MTLTFSPIAWDDVYLTILAVPASALALLGVVFLLRTAWQVVTGYYEKRHD